MSDHTSTTRADTHGFSGRASENAADPPTSAAAEHPWHADVRRQVVERLRMGSIRHASNVWKRRRRDPVCHHAMALLYVHQEVDKLQVDEADTSRPQPMRPVVTSAWRYWLEGPETDNLARLLFKLHHHLAPKAATVGFDLLKDWLEFKKDDQMHRDAVYIGIGVTSLDTANMPWRDARLVTEKADDIASSGRIVLTDGTIVAFHREGFRGMNELRVRSTHNLSYPNGMAPIRWSRATADGLIPDRDDVNDPFTWLTALGDTCAQADNRRVLASRLGGRR